MWLIHAEHHQQHLVASVLQQDPLTLHSTNTKGWWLLLYRCREMLAFITFLYTVLLRLLYFVQSGKQTKSALEFWINNLLTALVALLSLSSVNSLNKWVLLEGMFSETMTHKHWLSHWKQSYCSSSEAAETNNTTQHVWLSWKNLSRPSINAHNTMIANASRARAILWNYSGNDS